MLRNYTFYHRYPVPQEYNEMVDFILRKWKYLEKEFGTYRDGFNIWKDQRRTHFKNKRGRMGLDIPEVKAKREIYGKRKGGSAGNGLTDFKRVCVMWGVNNFLPPMGEGEDEETIAAHEKRLQHQSQLSIEKQDKLVVKRLLDLTYSKRRKLLGTDYTKISTILELYLILCSEQQVNEKSFCLYLHSSNSYVC